MMSNKDEVVRRNDSEPKGDRQHLEGSAPSRPTPANPSSDVYPGGLSRVITVRETEPHTRWLDRGRRRLGSLPMVTINRLNRQAFALFGAVALLWTALSLTTPNFLTTQNLTNILLQSSVIGVLAVGFTILLIGGQIDLSIASVQALAGTLAAVLIIQITMPIWLAMVLVVAVGISIGLLNAYFSLVARVPSFIVTLAMLGIVQGTAFVLTSGRTVGGFPEVYRVLGRGKLGPIPLPVVILLLVVIVAQLILSQTKFGVELYAIGGNRTAAELVGLRVTRVLFAAFVASAVLSTLGGVVLSSRLNAGHGSFGGEFLLEAVAAVIIGGTSLSGGAGSTFGTLGGVLLISSIKNGLVHIGVDTFWQQVVVGVLILGAVLVDGLLKGTLRLGDFAPGLRRSR